MNAAQAVRFGAVLLVLAGYAFVFRSGEGALAAQLAQNVQLAGALRAADATLAAAASTEAERARLRRALQAGRAAGEPAALVARFVRDAATTARAHRTALTALASTAEGARQMTARRTAPAGALALDLTIEGRYADVLATVRALPASYVGAAIELRALARKNPGGSDRTVSAMIHAALEPASVTRGGAPGAHAEPV